MTGLCRRGWLCWASGVPGSACERRGSRVRVRQSVNSGGAEEAAVKSGESGNITDRVHQI